MCTVIVRVAPGEPVRLLAVRDEDPGREWNPLGTWWPETYPRLIGVRDVRAGGAWLAADPDAGTLAVVLNRGETSTVAPARLRSRGAVVLETAAGQPPHEDPSVNGFNLVEVAGDRVRLAQWDGRELRAQTLDAGVHMIAHDDLDDPRTVRIDRWLGAFRAAAPMTVGEADAAQPDAAEAGDWFAPWLDVLARSARVDATDDAAIIRDNRPHGFPTQSLLLCTATVAPGRADVAYRELPAPARWWTQSA